MSRILILGSPRSGTTYVYSLFKNLPKYFLITEPFFSDTKFLKNNNITKNEFLSNFYNYENLVLKHHVNQISKSDIQTFDIIYKICRRNSFEQTLSFARSRITGVWNLNPATAYQAEPCTITRNAMFDAMIYIMKCKESLKDQLATKTVYYEDLTFDETKDCNLFALKPNQVSLTTKKLPSYEKTIKNLEEVKSWWDEWNA